METAVELVRNFTQRIRNFIDFMDDFASDETPRLQSASMSEHDMEHATSGLETSDEGHGGAAGDRNDVFRGFYTGEHRDDNMPGVAAGATNGVFRDFHTGEHREENSFNIPNSLGFELPSPPAHFRHNAILPPQLRLSGGAVNTFERHYTGEHHPPTTPLFDNAFPFPIVQEVIFHPGPASSMQAGANFLNQLPDIGLGDIPNVTSCNICMESFGSTEDPESESPVQIPCGHVMGRKCISRWLETSNSCPMCRHVLFEQTRRFPFQREGDFPVGQEELNRSWDDLEPRLQQLVRSMTAQEQRHLLQMLQESNTPEPETVQREQLQVPGVSPEEMEAYQAEYREIGLQWAAIDRRLEEMELENVPLTSQRAMEVRELDEDNEMLSARLDNFHLRYRYLINFTLFS